LPVRELDKPANTKCRHQSSKGCGVYRRAGFPASCALWSCRWLLSRDTADLQRPDRTGYVLDLVPDVVRARDNTTGLNQEIEIVQVWVRPGADPLKERGFRRYAERQAKKGIAMLLRFGTDRAVAVFPPAMASDEQWHVIGDAQMVRAVTQTGNLLLDRLKGEPHA